MPLSPVELYERLKPHLGEDDTKALIEYVDGKIKGEVATKEDLHLLKAEFREEIWKLRVLVIVVLVLQIALNPKVVELVGRILGVVK
jgi:hypothetical protein